MQSVMQEWANSKYFSQVFSEIMERTGVTCYQINQYSGLDQSYLSRLKNGEKLNPSIGTVLTITYALVHFSDKVDLYDVKRLFKAAGYYVPLKE